MLEAVTGTETWVKHENNNPTGAFKVRGGLRYVSRLRSEEPNLVGLIAATRGNHGQSIAFAGSVLGVPVTIVAPESNSPDKNAAMRALGADLVLHGQRLPGIRGARPPVGGRPRTHDGAVVSPLAGRGRGDVCR